MGEGAGEEQVEWRVGDGRGDDGAESDTWRRKKRSSEGVSWAGPERKEERERKREGLWPKPVFLFLLLFFFPNFFFQRRG